MRSTVLHQIVREDLQTMLAEASLRSESGRGYPRFIEREFRRYLDCACLGRGFARVRCKACGYERLLAFSCKGRLCPSCQARRMQDVALHLGEQVIPAVPLRQWVMTDPRALRFTLARDRTLRRAVTSIVVRSIFMLQRRQARAEGFTDVMPGAITFLHEAGSALNLNPHTHSLVPDGVFAFEPEQPATFLELPAPTQPQIERVLGTVVRRVGRLLEGSAQGGEVDLELDDSLAHDQAHAVQLRLQDTPSADAGHGSPPSTPRCAWRQGFSLHAAVTVAADDKQGRLRLLRYGARPALSSQHLSRLPDGRVRYQLRRSAGPGSSAALTLVPTDFLRRLAATLPPPYQHRTVYHGIFAPAASRRFEISPAAARPRRGSPRCHAGSRASQPNARHYLLEPSHRPDAEARATQGPTQQAVARFCAPPPPLRSDSGRIPWSELIARTFPDALDCPTCGATLSVIADITELAVVRKILEHLGLPPAPTELAPARPHELGFELEAEFEADLDQPCSTSSTRQSRSGGPGRHPCYPATPLGIGFVCPTGTGAGSRSCFSVARVLSLGRPECFKCLPIRRCRRSLISAAQSSWR